MPRELRAYRLLRLGVSLTEQDEAPTRQLDWLLAIDSLYRQHGL